MVRGTPGVKRTRTISVRVSQEEWAAWDAAREASGRAEMGAWVRALVEDVLGTYPPGGRPGEVPRVPEVNVAAYEHLVGVANNLNQLTRYSHQRDELADGAAAAIGEVVAAARAVRGLDGLAASTPARTPARGPARAPAASRSTGSSDHDGPAGAVGVR